MLQDTISAMRDVNSQLTTCGLSSDDAATLNSAASKLGSFASCAGPVIDRHAAETQKPFGCIRDAVVTGRDCVTNASCDSSKLKDCGNRAISSINGCKGQLSAATRNEIAAACGQSNGQGSGQSSGQSSGQGSGQSSGQGSGQATASAELDPLEAFDDVIEAFVSVW
jgi:hypothetical protein